MARHTAGSHPKLTVDLVVRLSDVIRSGAYVETAVALCGISKDTFYRWLREANEKDSAPLLHRLSDAVKKAMAESELRDLAVIDKAAQKGEWTAAAWRLERKHPERWGRKAQVHLEHSGPAGGPIEVEAKRANLKKLVANPEALAALEIIENQLSE